jgi:FkbM family methyltransferase
MPENGSLIGRLWQFSGRSASYKRRSIYNRIYRWIPGAALPIHLPFDGWWLARNDFIGAHLVCGGFETPETNFVSRFLKSGMHFVDLGAHHGYYTLLASRKVGKEGSVLAIEPSPRERKRLDLHLRINRCQNVEVESRAIGEAEGSAELHLVLGSENGCNSLRKPEVSEEIEIFPVAVQCLDRVLEERNFPSIDLLKMDVEGAELSVLRGAGHLLRQRPRPVVLAEVQDVRTNPWGYPAKEIIAYLSANDFRWFTPLEDGSLESLNTNQESYDGNFVAVPGEGIANVKHLLPAD